MLLKDKLREYYEMTVDDYINNPELFGHIQLTPNDIKEITLEDIFTIIYLVTFRHCKLDLINFNDVIVNYYDLYFDRKIPNMGKIAMLFIIANDPFRNRIITIGDDDEYFYNNKSKFIRLAIQFDMLHLEKTKNIMTHLQLYHEIEPNEIQTSEVKHYLGIIDTKSARNI